MKYTTATIFLMAAIFPLLSGCGGPETCQVSGQITYNGQAVQAGMVSFEPAEGKSQAQGMLIKDGQYESSARAVIKPGKYIVRISAPDLLRTKTAPNAGPNDPVPPTVPLLPPNWNAKSNLSVDLKTGKNTLNFSGEKIAPPTVEILDAG